MPRNVRASWKDNVYGVDYTLIVCQWSDFVKEFSEDGMTEHDEEPAAFTLLESPGMIRTVVFWFPPRIKPTAPRWISAIAHEALHATLGVLSDRGIKKMNEDTEAATYYLGWVIEEMLKCLRPERRTPVQVEES